MTQDYKPGDDVIWTNPANGKEFEATIEKKVPPQAPISQYDPSDPRPQGYPALAERVRHFEIRVKETGKTMTVPISQLRRAN